MQLYRAIGSVDLRHKPRAYCVSTITPMHSFPCFDQSHGIEESTEKLPFDIMFLFRDNQTF